MHSARILLVAFGSQVIMLMALGIIDSSNNSQLLIHQALAQQQIPSPPSSITSAMTATSTASNTTTAQEILQQGIVTSSQARQNETSQIAIILPHRPDGKTYTGVLTFTASRPVEVGFLHRLPVDNATLSQIDFQKYGKSLSDWIRDIPVQHQLDNQTALQVISGIVPNYGISTPFFSASIPFVANGVTLWSTSGEPFIAGYEVSAKLGQPEIVNNIATTANTTTGTDASLP